ncbi:MAG: diguanylate cyclase [Spirochaetales bacterium]|nr:diguanylate cyclase [Spirochaetales bacterium]
MEAINILLVKYGQKDKEFLKKTLTLEGYMIFEAPTKKMVIDALKKQKIHIIIINVPSLSKDVQNLCRDIRKQSYHKPLQIVFTTDITEPELYDRLIDLGADDFLKKPLNPQEIQARLKAALLRLKKQSSLFDEREYFKNAVFQEEQLSSKILDQNIFLKKAFQTVAKENKELKKVKKELEKIAMFDTLSGLLNRLSLFNRIDIEIERAIRAVLPLSGIMLDIDHFKEINDNFGHQCGDLVIKEIGIRLRNQLRKYDYAGRYGGEEFFIILPNTTLQQATTIGERFRKEIAKTKFICNDEEIAITVSMGIAQYRSSEPRDKWIERADKIMYVAKQTGRNRVCTEQN